MKSPMLQKLGGNYQQPASGSGLKIVLYLISLGVAFYAGQHFERSRNPASPAPPETSPSSTQEADATPAQSPATATPAPIVPSPSTAPVAVSASTPVRIERAIPVTPVASTPAASAIPTAAPATPPVKKANDVTILEPIEIPVKQGNKITGYIHLQPGQTVTPISVERDQIKIKCGEGFVFVPVKSTDMPH